MVVDIAHVHLKEKHIPVPGYVYHAIHTAFDENTLASGDLRMWKTKTNVSWLNVFSKMKY